MKHIFVSGTCDTKGTELDYVRQLIRAAGGDAMLVDVSTGGTSDVSADDIPAADISATVVASHHPQGVGAVLGGNDRGKSVAAMGKAFARFVESRDDIAGIIGIGGSGATSIITAGMRQLSIGVPKLMVSTLASGDVAPYVGPTDITMMYSLTDVAGLNSISRKALANAAHAIAGMVMHTITPADDKAAIGLTMFGVTTSCVTAVTDALSDEFDCLVFHATGTGGQAMEKLVDRHMLKAVIDVTTTEGCDRPHRHTLCRVGRRTGHGQFPGNGLRASSMLVKVRCAYSFLNKACRHWTHLANHFMTRTPMKRYSTRWKQICA